MSANQEKVLRYLAGNGLTETYQQLRFLEDLTDQMRKRSCKSVLSSVKRPFSADIGGDAEAALNKK